MANSIIETFDLTKIYKLKGKKKEITALNNVNLSIKEGEIFGLLGPNGAGKTTLIQILTTLKQPTSGDAVIDGLSIFKNPKQTKSRVALMLENKMLYYRISAYDNLKFFCKMYNIPDYKKRINKIINDFGLEKWLYQLVENYSSGMKMKLALCRTFLLNRKVTFLDEPTLGLDVKSIDFIVKRIKESKKTIFLNSQDMNVVEKLCDRIAFINNGTILKVGTQEEIKNLMQKEINVEIWIIEKKIQLKSELEQKNYIKEVKNTGNGIIIEIINRRYYKDLFLILSKYNVSKIKESGLTLEDLFIKLN